MMDEVKIMITYIGQTIIPIVTFVLAINISKNNKQKEKLDTELAITNLLSVVKERLASADLWKVELNFEQDENLDKKIWSVYEPIIEDLLNAYNFAAVMYLEKKVHKQRFRILYEDELNNLKKNPTTNKMIADDYPKINECLEKFTEEDRSFHTFFNSVWRDLCKKIRSLL